MKISNYAYRKVKRFVGFCEEVEHVSAYAKNKEEFLSLARSVANSIAQELGVPKKDYGVRTSKGGPAVSGDVSLHAMLHENAGIMVNFGSPEMYHYNPYSGYGKRTFMYRRVKGLKDFTGGGNWWMTYEKLAKDFSGAVHEMAVNCGLVVE